MSAHYQYCTTYEKQVAVPAMAQATPGYELLLGKHSTDYMYLITAVIYEHYRCYSFSLPLCVRAYVSQPARYE